MATLRATCTFHALGRSIVEGEEVDARSTEATRYPGFFAPVEEATAVPGEKRAAKKAPARKAAAKKAAKPSESAE